jgi:hypothetical protein
MNHGSQAHLPINVHPTNFAVSCSIEAEFMPGALDILLAGDEERYNAMIANAAREMMARDPDTSCIALAMFSMACAGPETQQAIDVPVLTSPQSAVLKLKRLLGAGSTSSGGYSGEWRKSLKYSVTHGGYPGILLPPPPTHTHSPAISYPGTIDGVATTYKIVKAGAGERVVGAGDVVVVHATGVVGETGQTFWSTKDQGGLARGCG